MNYVMWQFTSWFDLEASLVCPLSASSRSGDYNPTTEPARARCQGWMPLIPREMPLKSLRILPNEDFQAELKRFLERGLSTALALDA